MKMKLRDQILLVNIAILAGLVFEYFRGSLIVPVVIAGVVLLAAANATFFIRLQRAKKPQ